MCTAAKLPKKMGSFISRVSRASRLRGSGQALTNSDRVNVVRPPVPEHLKANMKEDLKTAHEPNKELLDRLKDVYVSSTSDVVTHKNPYASERGGSKLPQERQASEEDSYEIAMASQGYLTMQQLEEIFERHAASKEEWPAARVASTYKIDQADAENLLQYFSNYKVVATFKDPRPDMNFHHLHE